MGENEVASLPRRRRRREFAGNEEEGGLEASPGRGFAGVPTVKCGAVSGKPVTGPIFSVLAGDMTTIIPVNPQPLPNVDAKIRKEDAGLLLDHMYMS